MRKFISIMLAAAMALSLTACGKSETPAESTSSAAESGSPATGEASVPDSDSGSDGAQLLSNPIALTEDGDIDMDVALAYETDFDALKASFEAKEVDATKPVSENAQSSIFLTGISSVLPHSVGTDCALSMQEVP